MNKLFLETETNVIEMPPDQVKALLRQAKGKVLPPIINDEELVVRYRHNGNIVNLHLSQYMHYGRCQAEYLADDLNAGEFSESCQLEKITTHPIPVQLSGIPLDAAAGVNEILSAHARVE